MAAGVRVLTVSYSCIKDDPRVMTEGRILASLGYRVSVVGVALGARPMRSTVDGMKVTVTPLVSGYAPRAIAGAVWALLRGKVDAGSAQPLKSTYLSLLFFNLWVLRLGFATRPQIIHCQEHQPLPSAWLLARLLRVRLVYDSHENTSLNRAGVGFKGAITIRFERLILPRVDAVITVGERLARSLRERGARRVVVVGNWKRHVDFVIDGEVLARLRSELGLPEDALVVAYIGALDPTRDVEPLLAAVGRMPEVHLVIAGRGALEPAVAAAADASPNIHWLGWLPLEKVPTYTQLSDVIYCCMNPSLRQLEFQMPNKVFDAFVARKAVIARSNTGEMSELLARYPAGIELDEVTPETIQAAFERLKDPAVLRSLQAQAEAGGREYNSTTAEGRLRDLFRSLAGDPAAAASP